MSSFTDPCANSTQKCDLPGNEVTPGGESERFSYFSPATKNIPTKTISVEEFIREIQGERWKQHVAEYRSRLEAAGGDSKLIGEAKKWRFHNLAHISGHACIADKSTSATPEQRNAQFTGIAQGDYDNVSPERLEGIRAKAEAEPCVRFWHRSPSGNGIKIGLRVPIAANEGEFSRIGLMAKLYLQRVFGADGLDDKIITEPWRLWCLSHDPDAGMKQAIEIPPISCDGHRHAEVMASVGRLVTAGVLTDEGILDQIKRGYPDKGEDEINEIIRFCREKHGKPEPKSAADNNKSLLDKLDERRADFNHPPEKPEILFRIGDKVIGTPGNLVVISGPAKVAKSALISAMISTTIKHSPGDKKMTFGIKAANEGGRSVIHFDTEQSRFDHFALVSLAAHRAGFQKTPELLRSYCVTDIDTNSRREMLRLELERSAESGVYAIFLDGVADFVNDVNDTLESMSFVQQLHSWAIRYSCVIVCVLHENPGSDSGKTRGHLGSQLERKAETNLRLQKDANGVTTIWSDKARHCSFSKPEGVLISYDAEQGLHLLVGSVKEAKASVKREELEILASSVFEGQPENLTWTQVRDRVRVVKGISESGARKKLEAMVEAGVIEKNVVGGYELSSFTPDAP